MAESDLVGELDAFLAAHQAELVEFRRDLHAHPEVGYSEHRTTRRIALRLEAAGVRPGKVRLIFQPAEEVPGGALDVLAAGGISSVERVFALHCDPKLDAGKIGTRVGPITAACDKVKVKLSGPGGHTARPHLTADLVFALGKIITELPAALSRRIDPRSGLSLVWGLVSAGSAPNAIPDSGVVEGTVRCLDDSAWHAAPEMLKDMVESVASVYGVTADLTYERSVPPAVNEAVSTAMIVAAADRVLGSDAIAQAPQSLGGEDFAWYLESVPGSLFRLGTRSPGSIEEFDIHQPNFDVDERCVPVGVKVMAATALTAIGGQHGSASVITDVSTADPVGEVRAVGAAADGVTLAGPLLPGHASV